MCQDVSQETEGHLHMACRAKLADENKTAIKDKIGKLATVTSHQEHLANVVCGSGNGCTCSIHYVRAWHVFAKLQGWNNSGIFVFFDRFLIVYEPSVVGVAVGVEVNGPINPS